MEFKTLIKEQYYSELDRKDKLTNALTIPLGVLTLLGGLIGYLLNHHEIYSESGFTIKWIISLAPFLPFGFSVYFFLKVLFNYTYGYIASPLCTKEYFDSLREYYDQEGGGEQAANDEFKQFILNSYINATEENRKSNNRKASYLHKTNKALSLTIVVTAFCGLIYVGYTLTEPQKTAQPTYTIYQVELEEPIMGEQKNPGESKKNPKPQKLEKPVPPPVEFIKESEDQPKKKK